MRRLLIGTSVAVAFVLMTVATARAQTQQQAEEAIGFADIYKQSEDWSYGDLYNQIETELERHAQYVDLIPLCYNSMTQEEKDTVDQSMAAAYESIKNPDIGAIAKRDEANDHLILGDVCLSLAVEYYEDVPPNYAGAVQRAEEAAKFIPNQPSTGHYIDASVDIDAGLNAMSYATLYLDRVEAILQIYLAPGGGP